MTEQMKEKFRRGDVMTSPQVAQAFGVTRRNIPKLESQGIISPIGEIKFGTYLRKVYDPDTVMKAASKYKQRKKITLEAAQVRNAKKYVVKDTLKEIIDAWNIAVPELTCTRNRRVEHHDIPKIKKEMQRIKRIKDEKYVLHQVEQYLAICRENKHLIKGGDYSYSSLQRFLERVYSDLKNIKPHWWEREVANGRPIEDAYPKLTQFIANHFARRFIGKQEYKLKNPSRDYRNFLEIAKRVDFILTKYKDTEICSRQNPLTYVTGIILECVGSIHEIIYPGTIAREVFWNIEFPQYLLRETAFAIDWEGFE